MKIINLNLIFFDLLKLLQKKYTALLELLWILRNTKIRGYLYYLIKIIVNQ